MKRNLDNTLKIGVGKIYKILTQDFLEKKIKLKSILKKFNTCAHVSFFGWMWDDCNEGRISVAFIVLSNVVGNNVHWHVDLDSMTHGVEWHRSIMSVFDENNRPFTELYIGLEIFYFLYLTCLHMPLKNKWY